MSFGHFGEGLPGTNSLSHSGTPSPVRGGPALQLRLPGSGGQGHMTLVWPLRPAHERQAWLHRRHGEDCLGPWGAVGAVAAGAVAVLPRQYSVGTLALPFVPASHGAVRHVFFQTTTVDCCCSQPGARSPGK